MAFSFLTSLLSSLLWRSCWGPRLCTGTGQCLLEYAEGGRSPIRTGFPGEDSMSSSQLRERGREIKRKIESRWQKNGSYLFGIHVEFLSAHGNLFVSLGGLTGIHKHTKWIVILNNIRTGCRWSTIYIGHIDTVTLHFTIYYIAHNDLSKNSLLILSRSFPVTLDHCLPYV